VLAGTADHRSLGNPSRGYPARLAPFGAGAALLAIGALSLPAVAVTGLGIMLGTIGVGLLFAYRYHVYVDATFGLRRMLPYVSVGLFLLALGVLEHLLAVLPANWLPYVIGLMLDARRFFHAPAANETFLSTHKISFVVVARTDEVLGYAAPLGRANLRGLSATPFLHPVFATRSMTVYQVAGAPQAPRSPLLSGPYLGCQRSPIHL